MRLGCIGIGSNAIRLLVAGWEKGQLCAVHRERRGTRLFAGLVGGMLTEESMQSSVNAVGELARCARADGAQEIFVFATSAVRDAENGSEFTARCESACGAKVDIALICPPRDTSTLSPTRRSGRPNTIKRSLKVGAIFSRKVSMRLWPMPYALWPSNTRRGL